MNWKRIVRKVDEKRLTNPFKTKREITLSIIALVSISILLGNVALSFISLKTQTPSDTIIVKDVLFVPEATYTIFQNGSTYLARSGRTGEIKYSEDNVATLTSNVFNDLSSRTWLEKICFKGSFTVSNTIYIPSYTFLDLSEAKFTASNLRTPMFHSTGSNIEIYGGLINGSKPQTGTLLYGFLFNGSSNIKISQTKIVGTTWETIYFFNCRNVTMISTHHQNSGREGVAVFNDHEHVYDNVDLKIIGSTFANNNWDGIVIDSTNVKGVKIDSCTFSNNGYCGIKVNSGTEIQIINCQAINNTQHGIYIQAREFARSKNILVSACITRHNGESNIHIKDTDVATVEGCITKCSNLNGIWIENCNFSIVKGNMVLNNGQGSPSNYHGIYVTGTQNSIFSNNICTDDQTDKTQGVGIYEGFTCDFNTFENNNCLGNYYLNGLRINGAHSIVHNNQGFRTQNSGMAVIDNSTTVKVTHGLVGTPTSIIATPKSEIKGNFWISNVLSDSFEIAVDIQQTASFYWYAEYDPV